MCKTAGTFEAYFPSKNLFGHKLFSSCHKSFWPGASEHPIMFLLYLYYCISSSRYFFLFIHQHKFGGCTSWVNSQISSQCFPLFQTDFAWSAPSAFRHVSFFLQFLSYSYINAFWGIFSTPKIKQIVELWLLRSKTARYSFYKYHAVIFICFPGSFRFIFHPK